MTTPTLLTNAHVIDPDQGIDAVCDVLIADGKIAGVGAIEAPAGAERIDLKGKYLTPGWIDIHVHAYGTLGFSDVDSIGVYQGVTSMVDAGGAGIATLDEFMALIHDRTETNVYSGPHIQPLGIAGFEEGGRALNTIAVEQWLDWAARNPGVMRYLKVSAYSLPTPGPLYLAKGMAQILGLPLYQHIGEMVEKPITPWMFEYAFDVASKGDIITHVYHDNPGKVIGKDGKLLACVRAAMDRGVLFDIGFGSMNFAWSVAEKSIAQGLLPEFISSDLQQFNIVYPCHSLANVMALFLRLGFSVQQCIERVTINPARALKLTDRAGSLRVGLPADVTVFTVESGEYELFDCYKKSRMGDRMFVPVMAFRAGKRFDCDVARGEGEDNWFMQVAEDDVPERAAALSQRQRDFLDTLRDALSGVAWVGYTDGVFNLKYAYQLHDLFHDVVRGTDVSLREGLDAVFACFLDRPFTMQIGMFLMRQDRMFVLERLGAVTKREAAFA